MSKRNQAHRRESECALEQVASAPASHRLCLDADISARRRRLEPGEPGVRHLYQTSRGDILD